MVETMERIGALTFSWSIWRSSLISLSVRLASILLSNALAIFLIATCSPVSELSAELPSQSKNPNPKTKSDAAANGMGDGERGGANEPDDAVGALADGEDGGLVLGGDLEHVPEDVVLDEPPAMAQRRLDVLHHPAPPRRRRSRSRRLLPPPPPPPASAISVSDGCAPASMAGFGFGSRRGGGGGGREGKGKWRRNSSRDLVAFGLVL